MTEPAAPHGTTGTLSPPSANGSAPPRPGADSRRPPAIGMRPALIAGFAVLVVAVISSPRSRRLTTSSRPVGPNGTARITKPVSACQARTLAGRTHTPAIAERPVRRRSPLPVHPPRQMTHEKRVSRP